MNFLGMQQEVSAQLRFDMAVSANLTLIKRWINRAQQHMASRHDWSWLEAREIVQTEVDKTQDSPASSSVAVALGASSVTGTGTNFAATDVGRFIQFPDTSNDWYKITAFNSSTSIDIEVPFTGTASITGADYLIRTFFYPLSSNVDRIVSVKQAETPLCLQSMSPITMDRWVPFYTATSSEPTAYACWAQDVTASSDIIVSTSGNNYRISIAEVADEQGVTQPVIQAALDVAGSTTTGVNANSWVMQFFPWPTVVLNMETNFYRVPGDLSANTDTGVIPVKLRDTVLIEGAIAYGMKYLDRKMAKEQMENFEGLIQAAVAKDGQNRGAFTRLEAVDSGPRQPSIIQYPAQYPYSDDSY